MLKWRDKSNRELGYQILRCEDVENGCAIKEYVVIAEVGEDITEYSDSFTGDACYRVVAFGEGGRSGYSNEVCVKGDHVIKSPHKICEGFTISTIERNSDLLRNNFDESWCKGSIEYPIPPCVLKVMVGENKERMEGIYGEAISRATGKYFPWSEAAPYQKKEELYLSSWWENAFDSYLGRVTYESRGYSTLPTDVAIDNEWFKIFYVWIDPEKAEFPEYPNATSVGVNPARDVILLVVMKGILTSICCCYDNGLLPDLIFSFYQADAYVVPDSLMCLNFPD